MKIAILSQTYPPMISGAAIVAQQLAKGMADRGHSVLVITASDREQAYSCQEAGCRIERLPSWRNPMRAKQRFVPWPYLATRRLLETFGPEVIHTHEPFLMNQAALAHREQTGTPVLLTIHQLPWFITASLKSHNWLGRLIEQVFWNYARHLLGQVNIPVVPTQTIADIVFRQVGLRPRVISNGIDLQAYTPAAQAGRLAQIRLELGIPPAGAPVILHVGRLDKDKRVERVIEAAAQVMQQTDAHLLIVGDGTEKERLVTLCQQANILGRSHFPGFVSAQEMLSNLYQLSNVFITTSEIETQGIVLMEAAACALPIVAVRATSIPELVIDGCTGYLCQPGDIQGLARRLNELIANPALAWSMGQAGRIRIEQHALQLTLEAYEALYTEVWYAASASSASTISTPTWQDRTDIPASST